ncbi:MULTISPECIES: hypothetical protein [unclassified Pseudomonas]|uniref:hypothetical protein n=1 Tax=unclassified Pseudomonas TaxID=196821 RepID=UPI0024492763|nr:MULTISPECIES: hypothetical protein [unclassified Pseudomonas]MDG9925740.1 hypothetical protein [Pseudomonas sp. GD04045]MDH0037432.1 hypothetical protein [Pseudomonas sp. GD04019]
MKRGTAAPPPTLGEGCLQRYDPDALSETDGTEFPGAAELWRRLQQAPEGEVDPAQEIPAPD